MKKDDLIILIQTLVKKELKKELPNLLLKMIKGISSNAEDSLTPALSIASEKNDEEIALKENIQKSFNSLSKSAPRPKKQFTKNPILNEMLNETAPFSQMEKRAMTSEPMISAPGLMMENSQNPEDSSISPNEFSGLNPFAPTSALDLKHDPSLPGNLKQVLSRDYRALVRAMDKKNKA